MRVNLFSIFWCCYGNDSERPGLLFLLPLFFLFIQREVCHVTLQRLYGKDEDHITCVPPSVQMIVALAVKDMVCARVHEIREKTHRPHTPQLTPFFLHSSLLTTIIIPYVSMTSRMFQLTSRLVSFFSFFVPFFQFRLEPVGKPAGEPTGNHPVEATIHSFIRSFVLCVFVCAKENDRKKKANQKLEIGRGETLCLSVCPPLLGTARAAVIVGRGSI